MEEQLKNQMTGLLRELPEGLIIEIKDDLCINNENTELLPGLIAERMAENNLEKHFKNDCNDFSGLSFCSVTAGLLCDGEDYWEICLPLVVLWITKKPISKKNMKKLERLAAGYQEFHDSPSTKDVREDYRLELRKDYVAECSFQSEFLDLVKLSIAMGSDPKPILTWINKKLAEDQIGINKKIYHDWVHFLEE